MKSKRTGLTAWQMTMMALGTVIGGSFFLGSAIAIRSAGPAIIISYIVGGGLVYLILFSLSEMTTAEVSPGSFRTFAEKTFGPGLGFITGWVYWTGLVLAMSSEATAAALFIRLWIPGVSIPVVGIIIIIVITLANLIGAERLSKLESGLAAIKLLAIVGFIILALALITGVMPGKPAVGAGALLKETLFPEGIEGIAGSMLIVMFTYAGFEIIGLTATEASEPHRTVPRAIAYTVASLVGLYIIAIAVLLPLIRTSELSEDISPFVEGLTKRGITWAASVVNIVLITAILSTMLAAMFGLGRMMRSLADDGHAPVWLKDRGDLPYRGILFSGGAMLAGLALGFFLPKSVYLFLISSGGFSLLFTYVVILVTHYKFRKDNGCPPKGKCQLLGYPYTSWVAIILLAVIIASMPLVPGQGSGLAAGLGLVIFYWICYIIKQHAKKSDI